MTFEKYYLIYGSRFVGCLSYTLQISQPWRNFSDRSDTATSDTLGQTEMAITNANMGGSQTKLIGNDSEQEKHGRRSHKDTLGIKMARVKTQDHLSKPSGSFDQDPFCVVNERISVGGGESRDPFTRRSDCESSRDMKGNREAMDEMKREMRNTQQPRRKRKKKMFEFREQHSEL